MFTRLIYNIEDAFHLAQEFERNQREPQNMRFIHKIIEQPKWQFNNNNDKPYTNTAKDVKGKGSGTTVKIGFLGNMML